ncbi:MAG: hypothetical protein QF363_04040, partial [Planctomycetaceae bacterium]|nr:hypothetical protein [Planctomycetaceae bacterium]
MLLTSWIDSMRRTWRRDRYRRGVVRKRQTQTSAVEQLEDRTLLSSVVIESVGVDQPVTIDTQAMIGTGTLGNPQFDTLAIRSVDIAPASGSAISIDLAGDDTSKLVLDTITLQSVIAVGSGDAGLEINLQDVTVSDLVIDAATITGENGAGVKITLHDSTVDAVTIVDSTFGGDAGAGVRISLDGTTVREFNVDGNIADGFSVDAVAGERGVISPAVGVSSTNPLTVSSLNHGLSTGDVVQISGVVGNSAVNGKRVITVVNGDSFTVDNSPLAAGIDDSQTTLTVENIALLRTGAVLPLTIGIGAERLEVLSIEGSTLTVSRGANGTSATAHLAGDDVFATESDGTYVSGGEWIVPSAIIAISVKGNRLEGATGSDGLQVDFSETVTGDISISDNVRIEGVSVTLDQTATKGLVVDNNLLTENNVGSGLVLH